MDADFTNGQKQVEFDLDATGDHRSYQWFFIDPANSSSGRPLGDGNPEDGKKFVGVDGPQLIIKNPDNSDCGYYYCQIETTDALGFPAKTQTRRAALGIAAYFSLFTGDINITVPVQPLPVPGSTGPSGSCTGVQYCSVVTFRGATGTGVPVPAGLNYFTVTLTNDVAKTYQLQAPANYQIMVCDTTAGKANCANQPTNNAGWSFQGTIGHNYMFAVYFNCKAPNPSAGYSKVALYLNN